ncbi:Glu-tRNA(Gln) amidotransferase subunit GatE [Nanoarchaeota archaeon]
MAKDYKEIGFKCGLEIHQQLEGKKLFCNCPTEIRKEEPDFEIKRILRASAGETGAVDIAALHELEKGKYFVYQGYENINCLVELDEEPPHEMNKGALKTAIQVAKLLNADIVDTVQVMRKVVIDGSNVSGFQRTALIATNGYIEVNGKKIGIPTICLEEDACQAVERKKEYDTYNLSRLGIPLLEIVTDATISNPEECKEVAAKLGMILRSVPGMKRGIGSIRQDVNLSVKDTARVEIKGFQEYKSIPKVMDIEIDRRLKLIKQGKKLESEVRGAKPNLSTEFQRPMPGADRMYPETDTPPIKTEGIETEKIELIEEKADKIKKLGLGSDLAAALSKIGKADLLVRFAEKFSNVKPAFIAETMLSLPKTIRRKHNIEINPTDEDFETLFSELNNGKIVKESVEDILKENQPVKEVIEKYQLMSDKELETKIKSIIKGQDIPFNALIGKVMGALKGKADPKKIIEILNKLK